MIDTYGLGRRGANTGTSASVLTDDANFGGHGAAAMIEVGCPVLITSNRLAITAATNATPIDITTAAHGFTTGDVIDIWGVTPNTAANGRWTITVVSSTTFSLDGSVGNGATAAAGFASSVTAAPADEQSRLSSAPAKISGAMNLDPALSATAPGTFEVLRKPLSFDAGDGPYSVHSAIDEVLRGYSLLERRLLPLTSVLDGDMLASGTGNWNTYAGTPTLAKADLGFPLGLRVLRITAGAATSGVYANTIPVEAGEAYYLEATGMIGASGAAADAGTLILYDVTNATTITLTEYTITRFEPQILCNAVTMPSGCEQVRVVLQADANGDIIEWANVIFRRAGVREFTLADRPIPAGYLGKLYATTEGDWARRGDRMTEIDAKPVQLGGGIWQYHTKQAWGSYSLWYEEFMRMAAMPRDTSTTTGIKEHLSALATERLLFTLQGKDTYWAAMYGKAARDAATIKPIYEQHRSVTQPQHIYPAGNRRV